MDGIDEVDGNLRHHRCHHRRRHSHRHRCRRRRNHHNRSHGVDDEAVCYYDNVRRAKTNKITKSIREFDVIDCNGR